MWTPAAGGNQSTAGVAGVTARFTFTGRNVAWVAPVAANRGQANVYLDGTYVKTIDLYSASTVARRVVFGQAVGSGSHTLTVYVAGTSGRPWVDVDEFAELRYSTDRRAAAAGLALGARAAPPPGNRHSPF